MNNHNSNSPLSEDDMVRFQENHIYSLFPIIRKMDVQFVEEPDPIRQTILEVFAAFQTKAKFNDFDNH